MEYDELNGTDRYTRSPEPNIASLSIRLVLADPTGHRRHVVDIGLLNHGCHGAIHVARWNSVRACEPAKVRRDHDPAR